MSERLLLKHCYNNPNHITITSKKGNPIWYRHRKLEGRWLCHACNTSISHKGRIHSLETRMKFSLSHLGKKQSEETKKQRSISMMGHFVSEETKQKISQKQKGIPETLETKIKLSKRMKGKIAWNKGLKAPTWQLEILSKTQFKKGSVPWNKNKKHSLNTIALIKQKRLEQIVPFKNSIPEQLIQDELRKLDIDFQTHIPIYGQPDLFIEPNICIFVDGDYWHGNPKFHKANDIISRNKKTQQIWDYDNEVTQCLEEMGMKVIRLWEDDIINNIDHCITQVIQK